MTNFSVFRATVSPKQKGQGLVEFALVLPLLLLLISGIVEFGRMFAIYNGVSNASREAVRWGSVVGDSDPDQDGTQYYFLNCSGIRAAARRSAILTVLADNDIVIAYEEANDDGGFTQIGNCVQNTQPNPSIENGYRIVVTISATYSPILPLLPFPTRTFSFSAARTIFPNVVGSPACGDSVDNDNDGQTDYPNDVGCASAADPDETTANSAATCYPLTVNVAPADAGTYTTNPDSDPNCSSGQFSDFVVVVAAAQSGYNFVDWSGDASGTNPSLTVSMTGAKTVTASFAENCYSLNISVSPLSGGSVTPSAQNCATGYAAGTAVSLQASGGSGYGFSHWSGDVSTIANTAAASTTITMDGNSADGTGNKTITANFIPVECYLLDASVSTSSWGEGAISTSSSPANCVGGKYNAGTQISILATPLEGHEFVNWTADETGTNEIGMSNPILITIASNLSVFANFDEIDYEDCYTLTTNVLVTGGGVGGSVIVTPASDGSCPAGQYSEDTEVTVTAVANSGYSFTGWSGAASGVSTSTTVEVEENPTVVNANFSRNCYTLNIILVPGAGGSVSTNPASSAGCPAGKFYAGQALQATATPASGYSFGNWNGLGMTSTSPTDSGVMPAADVNVTARFNANCVSAGTLSSTTAQTIQLNYTNYTGATRSITRLDVTWPSGGNKRFTKVEFGVAPSNWSVLWSANENKSPTTIAGTLPGWQNGNTGMLDATTKTLLLTFNFNVAGVFQVTATFDNNSSCAVTISKTF